jgi:hypothetical protein
MRLTFKPKVGFVKAADTGGAPTGDVGGGGDVNTATTLSSLQQQVNALQQQVTGLGTALWMESQTLINWCQQLFYNDKQLAQSCGTIALPLALDANPPGGVNNVNVWSAQATNAWNSSILKGLP